MQQYGPLHLLTCIDLSFPIQPCGGQMETICIMKFRHPIWTLLVASCLILSTSQTNAQRQPDVGDQPGLLADDSLELDPEFQKAAVLSAPTRRRAQSSSTRRNVIFIWSKVTVAHCAMALALAAKVSSGRGWSTSAARLSGRTGPRRLR